MARLKLKAEGKNQELVLAYLEENASDDLAEKINLGNRSIADCWRFIVGKARSRATASGGGTCAMISDDEVFGWAIHFFEETQEALKKESDAEASAAAKRRTEDGIRLQKEREKEAERKRKEKEEAERKLAEEAERARQQKEKEKAEAAARKAAAAEEKRKQKEFEATGAVAGQSTLFDFFSLEE